MPKRKMKEYIYLTVCSHCKKQQQKIVRGKYPKGQKTCVYCGRNYTLNKNTTLKLVKKL